MLQPKPGLSLHTVSATPTDAALAALAQSGIGTVELMPTLFDGDDGSRKTALKETLAQAGVRPMTVHALFGGRYDISVLDEDARRGAVAEVFSAIDLAAEFGAPMVVLHASAEPIEPVHRPARRAQARRSLAEIGRHADSLGRRIAVELLPRTCLGNTVEELLDLLEGLPPHLFGVCLDVNHLMDRWQSLGDTIRRLRACLITTHLSDYDGVDEKHWLPGKGIIDWAGAMAAFREIGYGGPLNYECRFDGGTVAERIATVEANFAWLRSQGESA